MAKIALVSPVTSTAAPMLAHLVAFLRRLHTGHVSFAVHLNVLFHVHIRVKYLSTFLAHCPLIAKVGVLHMSFQHFPVNKLFLAVRFLTFLFNNISLRAYMFLYLLSICELFVAHVTFILVVLIMLIIDVLVKVAGSVKHPVTGVTFVLSAFL